MSITIKAFCLVLAWVTVVSLACSDRSLRGREVLSSDGLTYLAISDDNGGACGPVKVDGEEWPASLGEPRRVTAGTHRISCGDGPHITFAVAEGTTLYFDYWGP